MELELRINGVVESLDIAPHESLLTLLRQQGYHSVKHGCETGECGACTVLVDGIARPSCVMLAAQAGGCTLSTVEHLGNARKLHPLQEAFAAVGAVQCGFCTPGMILSAHALLQRNPQPDEQAVRDALSGNLCRCTGYAKPVQAVLRAAAIIRGETVKPLSYDNVQRHEEQSTNGTRTTAKFATVGTMSSIRGEYSGGQTLQVVGKSLYGPAAIKLATGKAAFAQDILLAKSLHARILTSPHAHAVIRSIDVTEAMALPGVHAVLTYQDIPRILYSSVERSAPTGGLRDQYCLDHTVRYVGDRVAVIAAETPQVAEQALSLIQVEYSPLPAIFDTRQALEPNAPQIHKEGEGVADPTRNIAARLRAECGDVERSFASSDLIVEGEYVVSQTQAAPLENHSVVSYFDEDDNLVIRTCTQSPHHVQRTVAQVLGIPPKRIKVVKTHAGGDFGAKQEVVLEDLCALLTIATARPVTLAYSRQEEIASRVRHSHIVRLKTGVRKDGTILANQLSVLANTGAYGTHPLTNGSATTAEVLELYPCAHVRFAADVLYTNLPPAAAASGYEMAPVAFALECHMDEIAQQCGMDALAIRRKNWVKAGDQRTLVEAASIIESCGLPPCLSVVEEQLQWKEKRTQNGNGRFLHGVGVALSLYTPVVSGVTSGVFIKLNEDGSFDLSISNGGMSDTQTMLTQMAAEILGVALGDVMVHIAATDSSPAEVGTSTSATLYNSGGAIVRAAEQTRRQVLAIAGRMLNVLPETLKIQAGTIIAPDKRSLSIAQVAQYALRVEQRQIMSAITWKSQQPPTSFAAQGVEVEVDTETGVIRVLKAINAVDSGQPINPMLLESQIQGSIAQALGASIFEEILYDQKGAPLTKSLRDYHLYNALDMPKMQTTLIATNDSATPFGAKAVSEVTFNSTAPALANAVANALGTRIRHLPLTPERILRAIHARNKK